MVILQEDMNVLTKFPNLIVKSKGSLGPCALRGNDDSNLSLSEVTLQMLVA